MLKAENILFYGVIIILFISLLQHHSSDTEMSGLGMFQPFVLVKCFWKL